MKKEELRNKNTKRWSKIEEKNQERMISQKQRKKGSWITELNNGECGS